MPMASIMVVAAHPDDETLGAGAAMAKHAAGGDSVSVLILGTGVASRKGKGESASGEINTLRENSRRALAKLGVKDAEFLDFPDNRFDSINLLDIVKALEKVVESKKPEMVYTHHWGDLNIDHRIAFNAVMTACRPVGSPVKKILCFEVPSSTEWNTQNATNAFMPNLFVDVADTLAKKIAALREYKGEMRPYPHPRSPEGAELLARSRGLAIGAKAAEAFEIAREIVR
jgi:LmbE family N-acetylglucosaminyl deacetylase